MVSMFRAAVLACAVAIAATSSASAAQLFVTGKVTAPTVDYGKTFSLLATYTPSTTASAVLNSATLVVGNQTWSTLLGGTSPAITIASARNAFTIAGQFTGSSPSNVGDIFTSLSLNITAPTPVAARQATQANIDALFGARTSGLGTLTLVSSGSTPFGGPILNLEANLPPAVPEPGSLLVLGGLGLFVGRRMLARRQNKAAAV